MRLGQHKMLNKFQWFSFSNFFLLSFQLLKLFILLFDFLLDFNSRNSNIDRFFLFVFSIFVIINKLKNLIFFKLNYAFSVFHFRS